MQHDNCAVFNCSSVFIQSWRQTEVSTSGDSDCQCDVNKNFNEQFLIVKKFLTINRLINRPFVQPCDDRCIYVLFVLRCQKRGRKFSVTTYLLLAQATILA